LDSRRICESRLHERRRVAPGSYLPGAPTDPDVPISGIRLVREQVRYVPYR